MKFNSFVFCQHRKRDGKIKKKKKTPSIKINISINTKKNPLPIMEMTTKHIYLYIIDYFSNYPIFIIYFINVRLEFQFSVTYIFQLIYCILTIKNTF